MSSRHHEKMAVITNKLIKTGWRGAEVVRVIVNIIPSRSRNPIALKGSRT